MKISGRGRVEIFLMILILFLNLELIASEKNLIKKKLMPSIGFFAPDLYKKTHGWINRYPRPIFCEGGWYL
jgi:hypothetical protein